MATSISVDLLTLAIKGLIIGTSIHMDDGTVLEVLDWELSMATDQICVKFTDGSQAFLMIKEKFKVDTPASLVRVNTGKIKKHKK